MPKVPVLDPSVGYGAPQAPVQQPLRPPEEQFGGGVAAATRGLGEQIERTGDVGAKLAIEHQQRLDEQKSFEIQSQFVQDYQKLLIDPERGENQVPKGYLLRQGTQALGSTMEFDSSRDKLEKQYVDVAPGTTQKQRIKEFISAHLNAARETIIQHEGKQSHEAFVKSFESSQNAVISSAALISDPNKVASIAAEARKSAIPFYVHEGQSDPETVSVKNRELTSKIVQASLTPLLESNPKQAQSVLDANKAHMDELDAAKIQNIIDGKIIHDRQAGAWNVARNFKLSTGEIDLSRAQKYVNGLSIPEDKKQQIFSYVHTMASVANSELKDNQESIKRSYTDQLVSDLNKVPLDIAYARAATTGLPPTMIAELQQKATDLYKSPQLRFDTWKNQQPQPTVAAIDESTLKIKSAYPNTKTTTKIGGDKVTIQQAALNEMENQWIGKTPAQIRKITDDALQEITTKHFDWWFIPDTKKTLWKMTAENRITEDMRVGQLQKDNSNLFELARAKVLRDNHPLVYENIKAAMEKIAERGQ
jgi:hypothetical protein